MPARPACRLLPLALAVLVPGGLSGCGGTIGAQPAPALLSPAEIEARLQAVSVSQPPVVLDSRVAALRARAAELRALGANDEDPLLHRRVARPEQTAP